MLIDLFGKPLSEDHWFSIIVWRKRAPGIIALYPLIHLQELFLRSYQ
jgi:hypothetical protein